jgi:hypothetical protein
MTSNLVALPEPGSRSDPLPGGGRLRWVNDRDERFQELIAKGYLIVERNGKQVTRPAGEPAGTQYLMQAPPALSYEPAPDHERITYNDVIDIVAEIEAPPVPSQAVIDILKLIDGADEEIRGYLRRIIAPPLDIIAEEARQPVRTNINLPVARRQRFIAWIDKHKRGSRVRERILRLNPSIKEGECIRGWHPAPTLKNLDITRGVMGKREFIRKFGREALAKVPRHCFWKSGKRTYIVIEAIQDRVWEQPPRT